MSTFKLAILLPFFIVYFKKAAAETPRKLLETRLDSPTNDASRSCNIDCARYGELCLSNSSSSELHSSTITSCSNAPRQGQVMLQLPGLSPLRVYCVVGHQLDGAGWIAIQQRVDGSENFYRSWVEYRDGFGDMNREFWLGLERIHQITSSGRYQLLVEVATFNDKSAYALYSHFAIAGERDKYRLAELGIYSGTAGDGLRAHVGMKFSTFDSDNDTSPTRKCSSNFSGAWWFKSCFGGGSHLNGLYKNNNLAFSIIWYESSRPYLSQSYSRMLLRRF